MWTDRRADTVCVYVCVLRGSTGRKGGREGCSSLRATALEAHACGLERAMPCFRLANTLIALPSSSSHSPFILVAAVLCVLYVC
jgi:hypothetical protein